MPNEKNELKKRFDSLKERFKIAYSRSEFETLLGELNSLANEAASYGINFNIADFKETAEVKVKNLEIEQNIDKFQIQKEESLKAQKAQKLAEEEKKLAALNASYVKFNENIEKNTEAIEKDNRHLDQITYKIEKENVVDHKLLDSKILTHEEIQKQHEEYKNLHQQQKKINAEHTQIDTELKELNEEIANLKQQLRKKDLKPSELQELKEELEFQQDVYKLKNQILKELKNYKEEANQNINLNEKFRKEQKSKLERLGNAIETRHKEEPQKYLEAKEKHLALMDQHKAIISNGIVSDKERHDKILNKIKADQIKSVTGKINKDLQGQNDIGNLCPSYTPRVISKDIRTR